MSDHNDSRARRSNGPLRRANHDRINWTKREPGPSPARKAQITRFEDAVLRGDTPAVWRHLLDPIED